MPNQGRKGKETKLDSKDYREAWNILYQCFGERMQQGEIDLMDSVLWAIKADREEFALWKKDTSVMRLE